MAGVEILLFVSRFVCSRPDGPASEGTSPGLGCPSLTEKLEEGFARFGSPSTRIFEEAPSRLAASSLSCARGRFDSTSCFMLLETSAAACVALSSLLREYASIL